MVTRRTVFAAAAGLVLVEGVLAAGRPALAVERRDPRAAWAEAPANRHPDWRVRAFSWAVLAPNPHNRQPWMLELIGSDEALLFADLDRRLPVTDPLDRQITIGLGAAVELFCLAAAAEGRAVVVEPFPAGVPEGRLDQRPVARLSLAAGGAGQADPLFAAAPNRRSAKLPFDLARPPTAAELHSVASAARHGTRVVTILDPAEVAAWRELTWWAWQIEAGDSAAHGETIALMRLGRAEVTSRPDGVSVWGPGLDELVANGVLTRAGFSEPAHPAYRAMVDRYRAMLAATPAYLAVLTPAGSLREALTAGRDWLRLNLAATAAGLAIHPVSQALQEFPAMAEPYLAAHTRLGATAPARVQMLARIGRLPAGAVAQPTPRWPAGSRILGV
ncbi:MAG: twin-arginine translocation pathway signal protein [Alphaproteobacteria bacterium]|nr:twin-arginine translocation pathway signal protein [Alphaproteobacteria bacterium]